MDVDRLLCIVGMVGIFIFPTVFVDTLAFVQL